MDGSLDRICYVMSFRCCPVVVLTLTMLGPHPWSWWWWWFPQLLGGGVQSPSRRIACKMWCVGGCAWLRFASPNCQLSGGWNLFRFQEPAGFDGWMIGWKFGQDINLSWKKHEPRGWATNGSDALGDYGDGQGAIVLLLQIGDDPIPYTDTSNLFCMSHSKSEKAEIRATYVRRPQFVHDMKMNK